MNRAVITTLVLSAALFAQSPANDLRAMLDSARAAQRAGNVQEARRKLEQILKGDAPADVAGQARLDLLRIHQRNGDWWEAAGQLRELRKLAPQEPEYAYQLGVAYQNLSRAAFDRMQAVAPKSARMQQLLGEQYTIAGEREKAITAFQQAIEADPKLAGSHLALAMIYAQGGKRAEALAEIDQELAIAPESAVAKQLCGQLGGAR